MASLPLTFLVNVRFYAHRDILLRRRGDRSGGSFPEPGSLLSGNVGTHMVVLGPSPAFWNPARCTWTHKCFQTSQRRIALILKRHPALCEGRGDASGPNVARSGVDRSKRVGG